MIKTNNNKSNKELLKGSKNAKNIKNNYYNKNQYHLYI